MKTSSLIKSITRIDLQVETYNDGFLSTGNNYQVTWHDLEGDAKDVTLQRRGRYVFYSFGTDTIKEVIDYLTRR